MTIVYILGETEISKLLCVVAQGTCTIVGPVHFLPSGEKKSSHNASYWTHVVIACMYTVSLGPQVR